MIAAVLLIAFTMAVASIFAQWAPQLMEDAQGDTTEQAQTIQACSDRTLDVSSSNGGDTVTVSQTGGTEGVGNLTVTFYYANNDPTQNSTTDDSSLSGISNSRGVVTIDSANAAWDVTRVEAQPVDCEGAPAANWEP